MDGFNIRLRRDMFRFVDNLRDLKHCLKRFVKRQVLQITINNKKYNVIGKVGMYHMTIDITGSSIKIGDPVYLDVNPIHVDGKIRREYI